MASLSVSAKEFIPTGQSNTSKSYLSVDVPEFVPKTKGRSKNNEVNRSNDTRAEGRFSKSSNKISKKEKSTHDNKSDSCFNPRHDRGWAVGDGSNLEVKELSARHDRDWFHTHEKQSGEKESLRKSDSYHVTLSQRSISLRTKAERKKLVQTFSLGYLKRERKPLQKVFFWIFLSVFHFHFY